MSQKVKILKRQEVTPEDEGEHRSDLLEWHYLNGFIEKSPNNPYSGWKFITNFTKVRNFYDNVMFLLFPPGEDPLDFTKYNLKRRTMKLAKGKLEGKCLNDSIEGRFPNYKLHIENLSEDGKFNCLDLKFSPTISPKFISTDEDHKVENDNSKISHYAFLNTEIKGDLTVNGETAPIKAVGYYEHVWATIDPKAFMGWMWYSSPKTSSGISINIAIGLRPDDSLTTRFVHYTFDGENYHNFDTYEVEILETAVHDDIEYGTKIHISQKTADEREMDITITRDKHPSTRTTPGGFADLRFITGGAKIEGYIIHDKKKYNVDGDSIGSSFLLRPPQPKK